MISRSFSPSKLPRQPPPPPPPPPFTQKRKNRYSRRRINDTASKQQSSIENPLMFQEDVTNADVESLEKQLASAVTTSQPDDKEAAQVRNLLLKTSAEGNTTNSEMNAIHPNSSGIPVSRSTSSFDVEDSESTISGSWRHRLRWFHVFQRKHRLGEQVTVQSRSNDHIDYAGGPMVSLDDTGLQRHNTSSDGVLLPQPSVDMHTSRSKIIHPDTHWGSNHHRHHHKSANTAETSSSSEDHETMLDFDASEWTPPDSSYGAAIPVAGWIPKSIRRSIEWTLLAGITALIVFFIVQTSLRSDTKTKNHKSSNNDVVYNGDNTWIYMTDDQYGLDFGNSTANDTVIDDDVAVAGNDDGDG
jgi:hypothetical protein